MAAPKYDIAVKGDPKNKVLGDCKSQFDQTKRPSLSTAHTPFLPFPPQQQAHSATVPCWP